MKPQQEYIILSDNLKGILEQCSPEEKEAIFERYRHYQGQYAYHMKNNYPLSVIASFLKEIDNQIEKQFSTDPVAKEVKCKKGCYFCCEQNVDVSINEAMLLRQAMKEDDIQIDMEKLKRQAKYTYDTWSEQPEEDWSCVFLQEDKTCAVYDWRPASCRKYFSASPPKLCDIRRRNQKIRRFVSTYAEILGTVIFNREGSGNLPNILLKLIDNET